MAHGFNRGIVFLLVAPLLVVGTIVLLVLKARWQSGEGRREGVTFTRTAAEEVAPSGAP